MEHTKTNNFDKTLMLWIILPLIVPAVSIILHELGHYLIGLFYGFSESKIYYAMTSYEPRSIVITPTMIGILAIGGPLSSILQGLVAAIIIQRGSNNPFLYGLTLFSQTQVLRNIKDITFSEEYRFGSVLKINNAFPWLASLIIFLILVTYVLFLSYRRKLLPKIGITLISITTGFLLWMLIIGPKLLSP